MTVSVLPPASPERVFQPNSWGQQEAFWDESPELLYSGALGTAKTRTACEKADLRCRNFPGAVVFLARRYRTDLGRTTLATLWRDVITPSEKTWGWNKSEDGGSTLHYVNGSRLLAVGCDSLSSIRGTEPDMIVVDQAEEMDAELWVELLSRCRHRHGPYQQLSGYCNPDSPAHFLYKRFRIDLGRDVTVRTRETIVLPNGEVIPAGYVLRRCVLAAPGDNAANLTRTNLVTLATMTGVQAKRLREGLWVMPQGLVYPEYTPGHVIPRPKSWARWNGEPPPSWPRICGVDFGFRNAFAFLWIAIDPDDRMFVYRELYCAQKSVPTLVREFIVPEMRRQLANLRDGAAAQGPEAVKREAPFLKRLNILGIYRDHDASQGATMDEMFVELMERSESLPSVEPADKGSRDDGIERVRRRLVGDSAGPALYFLQDLLLFEDDDIEPDEPKSILQEFGVYEYRRRPRVQLLSDKGLDEPVDRRNHALAALRYAVATYETQPQVGVY